MLTHKQDKFARLVAEGKAQADAVNFKIMNSKTQKQIQIDWIVNQLELGKERHEIWQELAKNGKTTERTFDRRLKEAREQHKPILQARKEDNDKTLSKDPEWDKTRLKLLESKKLIYESLSFIILKKKKKVNINGEERVVLDIDLENSRDLKTVWEMMMVGLGEPTTVTKTDNKTTLEIQNPQEALSKLDKSLDSL